MMINYVLWYESSDSMIWNNGKMDSSWMNVEHKAGKRRDKSQNVMDF